MRNEKLSLHYTLPFPDELLANPRNAIEYIMNTYGNDLKKLIYTYLNNEADTDDLIQEVFVTVYLKLDSFQGKSSLKSWIYSIAINKCKDFLRSQRIRNHKLIEKITRLAPFPIKSKQQPEECMIKSSDAEVLFKKIMKLPIRYREVIILFYYKNLSIKEISLIINEKEATIRTRLSRARTKLKELLLSAEGGIHKWKTI